MGPTSKIPKIILDKIAGTNGKTNEYKIRKGKEYMPNQRLITNFFNTKSMDNVSHFLPVYSNRAVRSLAWEDQHLVHNTISAVSSQLAPKATILANTPGTAKQTAVVGLESKSGIPVTKQKQLRLRQRTLKVQTKKLESQLRELKEDAGSIKTLRSDRNYGMIGEIQDREIDELVIRITQLKEEYQKITATLKEEENSLTLKRGAKRTRSQVRKEKS